MIMREATHAVILAGDKGKEQVPLWEEFCRDLNICIVVNLVSDFERK
jgi:CRISPR-associated protein Csx3